MLDAYPFFDVDDETVPMGDATVAVMERGSDRPDPSILAVRASKLINVVVRRSRRRRVQPPLDRRLTMIRMDELDPPPASQLLGSVAEICHSPLVQIIQF